MKQKYIEAIFPIMLKKSLKREKKTKKVHPLSENFEEGESYMKERNT